MSQRRQHLSQNLTVCASPCDRRLLKVKYVSCPTESFGDNEQLERAAQELESLLGGVIAGIEGNRRP